MQSDFTFVRTYLSTYIHECVHAKLRLLCPSPVIVMVGMCLGAASWQSKNGLLVTLPPSQPVAGLAPAPFTVAARCGTAVMFDGRDALGCCQLAV